jgi:hypothetical protein
MSEGGSEPCDLLQVETELDLIEGELAIELPAHMRAFARAHAEGSTPPAAPTLLLRPSTLRTARNALTHDLLADRGLALMRLVAPLVIESDPAVRAARAEAPSWPGLQRLAEARDAVAIRRFGTRAITLLHRLHGCEATPAIVPAPLEPPIDGWSSRDAAVDSAAIADAWQLVAARLGVAGDVRFDRASPNVTAQPRTFVIEPKREAIVVIPHTVDTPAARFAVLHELGHAFVALAFPAGVPRVVDEAAAALVARFTEPPSWLPVRWTSQLATAARTRRLALSTTLDAIERRLPVVDEPPSATPPWALWHDPGAQAAYVKAEALADRIAAECGPNPPKGQILRALTTARDRIDVRTVL